MSTELGNVFGRAAVSDQREGSGLAGRLPRKTTPAASPVAVPVAAPVAEGQAAPVAAPSAAPPAGSPTSEDASPRQITVYVLPHVPDAIKNGKRGRTNAAVVYDAIEQHRDKLPALLAARRTAEPGGGLFVRTGTDARDDGPTRVTWTFKAMPANKRVLDQLVITYRASSRSELVSTALEAAFPAL